MISIQPTVISLILFISLNTYAQKSYQKTYFENGTLKAEGWINNNQKTDYWKFYYSNGSLQKEGHFLKDRETNYWYFYNENDTKESEGHFLKGEKDDWWLFYDSNEEIIHKCQLKNNQKNGYCFRYKNSKVVKAEKYKSGVKIKEWADYESFIKENKLSDLK